MTFLATRAKQQIQTTSTNTDQKRKIIVKLPYIQGTSERLARVFKEHNVSTAMKPINKIRSAVVHPKDKIPKEKQNELIYRIPCKNCDFV